MGDALKYLYSQFILRDVLSFITPGAIVVLTAFLLLMPEQCLSQRLDTLFKYSRDMHWLLYIPLFGVFYIVGFAVQCFGEIIDIIRFTPGGRGSWSQRLNIFCCKWNRDYENAGKPNNKSNIWWWNDHERDADFFEATERNEGAQQGRERLVVLQQMCANGFLAIVTAVFLSAINIFNWSLWLILIVAIPISASLFWGYRIHVLRRFTRETIAINRRRDRIQKTRN